MIQNFNIEYLQRAGVGKRELSDAEILQRMKVIVERMQRDVKLLEKVDRGRSR